MYNDQSTVTTEQPGKSLEVPGKSPESPLLFSNAPSGQEDETNSSVVDVLPLPVEKEIEYQETGDTEPEMQGSKNLFETRESESRSKR